MMITNSDISVSLSDKDISKCFESKFDPEKLEELRATMKRRFETTGPTAADNPWKGMKYALDCVFIVEMDRRKFLIYQIFMPGGKINGHLYGQLNYVSGRWVVALLKKDPEKAFNISNPAVITDEFTKQKESSGLQALPLESLLK